MANPWNLGERENDMVARLTATGCNKEIARALNVSVRTVDKHLVRAYSKMKVSNRVQAAVAYDRWTRQA